MGPTVKPCRICHRRGAEAGSEHCRRCLWSKPLDAGAVPPPKPPVSTPPSSLAARQRIGDELLGILPTNDQRVLVAGWRVSAPAWRQGC